MVSPTYVKELVRNAESRRKWIAELRVHLHVLENWERNHAFLQDAGARVLRQIIEKAVKELLQWGDKFRKITA